jgi:hypothetical protein
MLQLRQGMPLQGYSQVKRVGSGSTRRYLIYD